MNTQVFLVTMLGTIQLYAFVFWLKRVIDMEDNLWIEPLVIVTLALFQYLIWK